MVILPKLPDSKVIFVFGLSQSWCKQLISWKYSLEKINGELELARKKKQALDKLLNEGKVSQPTYDSFSEEVAQAIEEIESRQKTLVHKMESKIGELEQQMRTLESLLVNSEIRHISGELENDAYDRECNVLSLGLETTKSELDEIKEAVSAITEPSADLQDSHPSDSVDETNGDESDAEKRLEIVMDTETTTSIETSIEEQAIDDEKRTQFEESSLQDDPLEIVTEEEAEASYDTEGEPNIAEDAESPDTAEEFHAEIPADEGELAED